MKKIILLLFICYLSACSEKTTQTVFIPKLGLSLGLTRYIIPWDDYNRARLWIGKNDSMASDYIEFNYVQCGNPIIYFVKPDTLYIIDRNNFHRISFNKQKYNINFIDRPYPENIPISDSKRFSQMITAQDSIYRLDSIIQDKSDYRIIFHDNAMGFDIFDKKSKLVYSTTNL